MTDPRPYAVTIALVGLAAIVAWPLLKCGYEQFRRQGIAFSLITAGLLWSMATKPVSPSIAFDDYLEDDGSHYNTNGTVVVGITIAWKKTAQALPNTEPLYISKRTRGSQADWQLIATTTVGQSPYSRTDSTVTNCEYYVWHEWVPPTPVHTNGVWIGNVVETAVGATNRAAKMVIIHGQLLKHGKVIAP